MVDKGPASNFHNPVTWAASLLCDSTGHTWSHYPPDCAAAATHSYMRDTSTAQHSMNMATRLADPTVGWHPTPYLPAAAPADYWEKAEFPFELVPKLKSLGIGGRSSRLARQRAERQA